jgi:methionyl-tRNA formyltransferase
LKILFAGTPANAAKTLELLVSSGFNVVGVLTRSDSPKGRNGNPSESPVAETAAFHGIDVFKTNAVSKEALDWMQSKTPDLGVIVAYGSILKTDALEVPSKGWLNVHYSLLPEYPGASPVQNALLDGKTTTGVTVFQLDSGVDTGPILSSQSLQITPTATSGSLLEELTDLGATLLIDTISNLNQRVAARRIQPKNTGYAVTRRINRAMARIDFRETSSKVVNLVRAMNPEPVAWFEWDSFAVRVLEAKGSLANSIPIGSAQLVDGELVVGCIDGAVVLSVVQPAGKKPMKGADWFRGLRRESLLLS